MGITQDITDQRLLQQQLEHTRQLDAIGRLAGGIAHDFNNLLTAILSAADLLKIRQEGTDESSTNGSSRELDVINKAAHRASELTSQLLAFGRRSQGKPPRSYSIRASLIVCS